MYDLECHFHLAGACLDHCRGFAGAALTVRSERHAFRVCSKPPSLLAVTLILSDTVRVYLASIMQVCNSPGYLVLREP